MYTVKFKNWLCKLQFARYSNGRTAIQLVNAEPIKEDGLQYAPGTVPIATATVNVVDYENQKPDEVVIKDYSENEGMLDCLVAAGIVSKPLMHIQTGWIYSPVCRLIADPSKG